jgi:Fur family zinc uptake transcriptional regulator
VSEAPSSASTSELSEALLATGFQVEQTIIEAEGVCSTCADK